MRIKQKKKTKTPKTNSKGPNTNKPNNTKTEKSTTSRPWNESIKIYSWNIVTGQLVCPVLSRSSIEATERQSHQHHRMNLKVPSKKSRNAETRDPPSQDPGDRKARPCRHDEHQCTSIASICRACEKMRVKRPWNESETYGVKTRKQQRPPASQSPLMCALAIIIEVPWSNHKQSLVSDCIMMDIIVHG